MRSPFLFFGKNKQLSAMNEPHRLKTHLSKKDFRIGVAFYVIMRCVKVIDKQADIVSGDVRREFINEIKFLSS
jgi:hypothetical protein